MLIHGIEATRSEETAQSVKSSKLKLRGFTSTFLAFAVTNMYNRTPLTREQWNWFFLSIL
jgi:hypothetical protein